MPPYIPGIGGNDLSGLVTIILVIVIGGIIFTLVRAGMKYADNSAQKPIQRQARVVAKRQEGRVSGGVNNMPVSSVTTHFITFQFTDGIREEFEVKGEVYGLLVEGDIGVLKSQGTWFQGFDRSASPVSAQDRQ